MEMVSTITTLISNVVTFAGGLLLLFGAVTLGTNLKDHNGPGISSGAWAMAGGVLIIAVATYFGTLTVGISGYVGSGEVNTTVDIENAIAALPGGIGNMPVALELMVVGWMLRIVNIVVNTIVAARFIELYVYNAMASLSIATLCYQELHGIAVNFLKSYLAVALQGAVLYLVIGFYPALAGSLGTGGSITEQAWAMLGQSVILLVAVFMSGKFTKAITNAMT